MHQHAHDTGIKVAARGRRRAAFVDMIKSPWAIRALVLLTDVVAITTSCVCFYLIRVSGLFADLSGAGFPAWLVTLTTVFVVVAWISWFWFCGVYIAVHNRAFFDEYYAVLKVVLTGFMLLFIALLVGSAPRPSGAGSNRFLSLLIYLILMAISLGLSRYTVRLILRRLRRRGIGLRRTIIIGDSQRSEQLLEMFSSTPELGFEVVGTVSVGQKTSANFAKTLLGDVADINRIIADRRIEVSVLGMEHDRDIVLKLITETSIADTTIKIIPDLYDIVSGQARAQHLYGIPLIEVNPQIMPAWEQHVKRSVDAVFSAAIIVLGMPLWLVLIAIIKLEDGGSVFYSQERIGLNMKKFMCYKFRSMRPDAEKMGVSWTMVNDPRVTRIGRILRRLHLDEVPQFWNVLKGDMSLVGPRPERPYYVEKYTKLLPAYPRRLRVKPGLTGWNQVQAEEIIENVEFVQERIRHDFFYIENMSLRLDIEILLRTILRVLQRKGQA